VPRRFYLPSSGAAPVSPAVSGDWEHNNAVRRQTKTWRTGTSIADTSYSPDGADDITNRDSMFVQFVSDPLLPQTIGAQTVKYALQGSETNAGNNCSVTLKVFVCSQDGSSIKETLLAIQRDGTELATTVTNRTDSGTTSSATVEEGDRLVFEFGIGGTPTASGGVQGHNGALRFGDNQATDLAENDTDTGSTNNPWLEFANDIAFIADIAPLETPGQAELNTVIQQRRRVLPAAVMMAALSFVPLEVSPPGGSPGVATQTNVPTIQYQGLAGPLFQTPPPAPDLAAPVYPNQIDRLRPHASRHSPSYTADRFDPPTPVAAPAIPQVYVSPPVQRRHAAATYAPGESIFGWVRLVPVESWEPRYPAQIARQTFLAAAQLASCGPVAPVVAASTDAGAAVVLPGSVPTLQYQSLAGPFTVAQQQQALDPLTWQRQQPIPVRGVTRPEGTIAAPVFVPDVTQPVTALSWTPRYPDRVPAKPRAADFPPVVHPAHVPDVTQQVTALSWSPRFADRVPAKPRVIDFPQPVEPSHVPDVTQPVTARSWAPTFPDRLHPSKGLHVSSQRAYTADTATTPGEVIAPALTPPVYPAKLWAKTPATEGTRHVGPIHVPDVTHPVTARSWAPNYPDRVWPLRSLHVSSQRHFTADTATTPGEVIAPAITPPVYPARVFGRTPLTHGSRHEAPLHVPDVTQPVTARSWSPTYPDTINRRILTAQRQVTAIDPTPPPATSMLVAVYPDLVPGRAPLRTATTHTAPLYLADVTVTAPVLSWRPTYQDWIDRRQTHGSRMPSLWWHTETGPDVVLVPVDLVRAETRSLMPVRETRALTPNRRTASLMPRRETEAL
jgi:hypothetical protein